MANQVGLGTSPGVLAQFGANVTVAPSQVSTWSNNFSPGLIAPGPSMITTVAYGQHEPGLTPAGNGPLRS
jgi:hypothetical protein